MSLFNGNVPENLVTMVHHLCHRPAMWVGRSDFAAACMFLDGYVFGLVDGGSDIQGHIRDHILHNHFQRFLVSKYGYAAARKRREDDKRLADEARARGEVPDLEPEEEPIRPLYGNIVWWAIYRNHFVGTQDSELFAILLSDFEQFANPLTRMSVEVR